MACSIVRMAKEIPAKEANAVQECYEPQGTTDSQLRLRQVGRAGFAEQNVITTSCLYLVSPLQSFVFPHN